VCLDGRCLGWLLQGNGATGRERERECVICEFDGFLLTICHTIACACQGPEADLIRVVTAAGRLDYVVNTLPGSAGFVLPDDMTALLRRWRPVTLEAAYIPRQTPFVLQALECGCDVVEGVELLFEQGCAQCEIWTGRVAPRPAIASDLLAALFTQGSEHPARAQMEPLAEPPSSLTQNASL
jgi:hypothetical protein